jgi:hypothetical protein
MRQTMGICEPKYFYLIVSCLLIQIGEKGEGKMKGEKKSEARRG